MARVHRPQEPPPTAASWPRVLWSLRLEPTLLSLADSCARGPQGPTRPSAECRTLPGVLRVFCALLAASKSDLVRIPALPAL